MLINVASPQKAHDEFQRHLDVWEQKFFVKLMPVLTAAVRLQVNTGSQRAKAYVEQRATPILVQQINGLYRSAWHQVTEAQEWLEAQDRKAARGRLVYKESTFTEPSISDFMASQLGRIRSYAASRIKEISQTLTDYIRQLIFDKVQTGRSNDEIAREIRARAPEIGRVRAATIARTETHGAALAGIEKSMKAKRIRVKKKTWWSAQDSRVRATHVAVHGTTIPVDEKFQVGDSEMERPGDPEGSAEEVINCRCSVLYTTETSNPL